MVESLVLYGSRARGDHRMRSDVDLLGITDGGSVKRGGSARGTNLHLYPYQYMLEQSKSGNLFLLHVTHEGKALYDSKKHFERVCDNFRFKKSYKEEILEASLVLNFCLQNYRNANESRLRKRLIWAIRTILIARAAERELVSFSSQNLETFSKIFSLKEIIDNRNFVDINLIKEAARRVHKKFGISNGGLDGKQVIITPKYLSQFGIVAADTPSYLFSSKHQHRWLPIYE